MEVVFWPPIKENCILFVFPTETHFRNPAVKRRPVVPRLEYSSEAKKSIFFMALSLSQSRTKGTVICVVTAEGWMASVLDVTSSAAEGGNVTCLSGAANENYGFCYRETETAGAERIKRENELRSLREGRS